MLLQIFALVASLLAVVVQFALHRSPDIKEDWFTKSGRRVTCAALVVAFFFLLDLSTRGKVYPLLSFVTFIFSIGQLFYAAPSLVYLKELSLGNHSRPVSDRDSLHT